MESVLNCDACGAPLAGPPVPGMAEVSLLQCDCGLVTTSPRPSPDELGRYYPETYYSYVPRPLTRKKQFLNKLRAYKGNYPPAEGPLTRSLWRLSAGVLGNFFLFYLPYRGPGKSLLEVGCGTGADLEWAKNLGWDVHGLELSESAVNVARQKGLDVRRSTFEEAEFRAESFDCIVMSQVLEHLYSPTLALQRCRTLLRPGGLLLLAVPKFDSWTRHAMGNYWGNLQYPIHLHHFTEPVLRRMVEKAGFAVAEVRLNSRIISLANTVRLMAQFRIFSRLLTRPRDTLSDVMLVVAEKHSAPGTVCI